MPTASRTKTALEEHRAEWNAQRRTGPMLRLSDLSQREVDMLNADFIYRCSDGLDGVEVGQVYTQTLHDWGVICPHPQYRRMYDGHRGRDAPLSFETSPWFACSLCGTRVINRP